MTKKWLLPALAACMLCLVTLVACSRSNDAMIYYPPPPVMTPDTSKPAADTSGYTWLALGDSYTIGQSVDSAKRYPSQTVSLLSGQAIRFKSLHYIATTGWTTGNLLTALQQTPPRLKKYDVVTLLIGVNNQYQGRSLEEYKLQFTQLLQQAIALAGNDTAAVVVLSIPDYGYSFYAQNLQNSATISQQIDAFNAANLEITRQWKVPYLDVTMLSRAAKGDRNLFASDGLHYSGAEYALWAALLAPMIKSALQ